MNATNPEPLLSLPGLARRIACDPFTLRTRIQRGQLAPDFIVGEGVGRPPSPLFRESRVPDVRRLIGAPEPA